MNWESVFPDARGIPQEYDIRQAAAPIEGSEPNACHAVRDGHARQAAAGSEGGATNTRHGFAFDRPWYDQRTRSRWIAVSDGY